MVDWKCNPGSLASTISCLCCLYMIYKPVGMTRSALKSMGAPVPFNITIMWCLLCCCMSSSGVTLADCGLQYIGLKGKLEEIVANARTVGPSNTEE